MTRNAYTPWTPAEEDFIRANYGKILPREMAKLMGRSATSIRSKAHQMCINKPQDKDDLAGRETNPFGLCVREVRVIRSVAPGRTVEAVCAHLGLKRHLVEGALQSARTRVGVYQMPQLLIKAERAGLLAGVEV